MKLRKIMIWVAILLAATVLVTQVRGQAATQTDNWCPEFGTITSARGSLWLDQWHPRAFSTDGIALLQAMDTSVGLQAYYGDPLTTADNRWLGVPEDMVTFFTGTIETDQGTRYLGFAVSESEPDVLAGVLMLDRTITGRGDQRGKHHICAAFRTDRATFDAIWDTGKVLAAPDW